ncbi:sialic acid-binding Ig-like lectin 5 isoform X1 [Podarcis raffonei]|uniref:sialic acid-binding Ig-like lectin 5 isoform X1 n=1 Tax=Podarcis raffonei TaxID=65483 RepID=UPI00232978C9|nr:sialic acid-binding Ig-like lectin 5 isoform X1 [Podarcis raffonei]
MIPVLPLNFAVLLIFWLHVVHFLDTCNVTIHPEAPAVEFGGSVNLNCTTTCANYTRLEWEVSVEGGIQKGDGWISLNITNVSEWELQPICIVQRAGFDSLDTNVVIYVYQFSTPVLNLTSKIVANHWEKIVCSIPSLKVRGSSSPSNVSIFLRKGSNVLKWERSISVEYSFLAKPQEDGDEILCEANLQVGSEVLQKSANRTLKIVASPYNVNISTNFTVYKTGAALVVKCHAEGKPFPEFSWDLPSQTGVEYSDNNKTITIPSAQKYHNGTYRCLVHNVYGDGLTEVDILYEVRELLMPEGRSAQDGKSEDRKLTRTLCLITNYPLISCFRRECDQIPWGND